MTNREFSFIPQEDVETALSVDNQDAYDRSQRRQAAGEVALRAFFPDKQAFGEDAEAADITGIRDALEPRSMRELDGEVDAFVLTREVEGSDGNELHIVARGVAIYGLPPEARGETEPSNELPDGAADGGIVDLDAELMLGDEIYAQRIQ